MSPTFLFTLAGLITAFCAFLVWEGVWREPRVGVRWLSLMLGSALLATAFSLLTLEPITAQGLHFRLPSAVALCTLIVLCIYTYGLLHHDIHGLGLFLLPVSALSLLAAPFLPDEMFVLVRTTSVLETGHLLISLIAYAIMTLAAIHAVMHLMLDRSLKRKQIGRLEQSLPSLMDVENHMYAQLRSATWLLGLGILTGLVWQWEELGHFSLISHKVILALFSWTVMIVLLIMRRRSGWQGRRASVMVIVAYVLLLLAYFGVHMVQSWLA